MEETLNIVNKIDQMYANSFSALITVTIAILTFSGVILPIVTGIIQKRMFKVEHKEIKSLVMEELREEVESFKKVVLEENKKSLRSIRKELRQLEVELNKRVSASVGGCYHIQTLVSLRDEDYLESTFSISRALIYHIDAENEFPIKRAASIMVEDCLPNLHRVDLEKHSHVKDELETALRDLTSFNKSGRYVDDINNIKASLYEAMERV